MCRDVLAISSNSMSAGRHDASCLGIGAPLGASGSLQRVGSSLPLVEAKHAFAASCGSCSPQQARPLWVGRRRVDRQIGGVLSRLGHRGQRSPDVIMTVAPRCRRSWTRVAYAYGLHQVMEQAQQSFGPRWPGAVSRNVAGVAARSRRRSGKAEPCLDTTPVSRQGSNAAGRRLCRSPRCRRRVDGMAKTRSAWSHARAGRQLDPARPGERFWTPHQRSGRQNTSP